MASVSPKSRVHDAVSRQKTAHPKSRIQIRPLMRLYHADRAAVSHAARKTKNCYADRCSGSPHRDPEPEGKGIHDTSHFCRGTFYGCHCQLSFLADPDSARRLCTANRMRPCAQNIAGWCRSFCLSASLYHGYTEKSTPESPENRKTLPRGLTFAPIRGIIK